MMRALMKKPLICLVTAILLAGLLPLYACMGEIVMPGNTRLTTMAKQSLLPLTVISPLMQNWTLWQSKHIQDYSYRLDIGGNFRPPPMGNFLVSVRSGDPLGYSRLDEPGDTNNQNVIKYDTFDKVFALLEQSYQDPTLHVDVTYDSVYGFPESVSMYSLKNVRDFSNVIKISEFTPA